jgi:hypothetical protein
MLPSIDPVAAVVLVGLVAFAVIDWLRWREKLAWFDRVRLERDGDERDR